MICTCDGNSLQNHVSSSKRENFFVFRLFVSPISGQLYACLYIPSPCLQVRPLRRALPKLITTSTWSVHRSDGYVRKVFWCMGAVHKDERLRGGFQYNNVLVPMVRRVARMRRHLASTGTGSSTTSTGDLQNASLTACNLDGWTLLKIPMQWSSTLHNNNNSSTPDSQSLVLRHTSRLVHST
jgi:hypothetical protein